MRLLKRREAAHLLRVSPDTVTRMVRAGHLRGFTVGKTCRVTVESVEELVGTPLPKAQDGERAQVHP